MRIVFEQIFTKRRSLLGSIFRSVVSVVSSYLLVSFLFRHISCILFSQFISVWAKLGWRFQPCICCPNVVGNHAIRERHHTQSYIYKKRDRTSTLLALINQMQGEQLTALLPITRSYILKLIKPQKSLSACFTRLNEGLMLFLEIFRRGWALYSSPFISLCGVLLSYFGAVILCSTRKVLNSEFPEMLEVCCWWKINGHVWG